MSDLTIFDVVNKPQSNEKQKIIDFLYENLEQYGDAKLDIRRAIEYALKEIGSFGGRVLVLKKENQIKGAVVVNQTGMSGYIPENILVYIATDKNSRGKGYGKILMKKTIEITQGDIALHVEANNPARHLYEKMGFSNPYLEMRLKKQ